MSNIVIAVIATACCKICENGFIWHTLRIYIRALLSHYLLIIYMWHEAIQLRKTFRLVLMAGTFCQRHLMFKQYKLDERVPAL